MKIFRVLMLALFLYAYTILKDSIEFCDFFIGYIKVLFSSVLFTSFNKNTILLYDVNHFICRILCYIEFDYIICLNRNKRTLFAPQFAL